MHAVVFIAEVYLIYHYRFVTPILVVEILFLVYSLVVCE